MPRKHEGKGKHRCRRCGLFGKMSRDRTLCWSCRKITEWGYVVKKARKGVADYAEVFALFEKYD